MTGAKAVLERLEIVIGIDGAPHRLTEIIEGELRNHFGLVAIQASERAETLASAVARMIAERSTEAEDNGTVATLMLVGVASDSVAGSCHILPSDDGSVAAVKRNRMKVAELYNAIRSLTFAEFEKFGARVLAELGASFTRITPHSNDQGIDFYGRLSLGQFQGVPNPFMKLAHDVVLVFVGQAKHYPDRALGPNVVRELIGAVALARTKTFSKEGVDFFPDLDLKPFTPSVTLLFTTGTITSGAMHLADAAGIIARSGQQIAVFLADKGIGMVSTAAGMIFEQQKFLDWLNARMPG